MATTCFLEKMLDRIVYKVPHPVWKTSCTLLCQCFTKTSPVTCVFFSPIPIGHNDKFMIMPLSLCGDATFPLGCLGDGCPWLFIFCCEFRLWFFKVVPHFYLTFSHCLIYSKLSSMFTSANVNQKISRTKKMSNCTVFQIGEKIFSDQNHAKV